MSVQELALERFTQCPLMTPTSPSPVETCAYALASWVLLKAFEGKFTGTQQEILHDIRGGVINIWKKHKVPGDPGQLSRVAGFRLFNLIVDYEVMHLEQPYNLILAGYTIQGKYALLRKRKGECLPHILILHTDVPALKAYQALPPDIATMARLLHIKTTTKYIDTIALHYPMFSGKHWMNKNINLDLARKYLESILKMMSLKSPYPSAGEHCKSCDTKPCLGVFEHG